MLLVFDGSENPKLSEICHSFIEHGGVAYVGKDAWSHLRSEAGSTMGTFVDRYIRAPLNSLLTETSTDLPEIRLLLRPNEVRISIGSEELYIERHHSDPQLQATTSGESLIAQHGVRGRGHEPSC